MKLNNSLEKYYKSLDDISLTNSDLDNKRDILKEIIKNYHNSTQSISIDSKLLKQNKAMAFLLTSTVESLKKATNRWVLNFEDMLEKDKFRSDLENYFIVIIFGKVKAGKSSLGNFIAQNRSENQKIEFFKYDEAGKEQSIKKLEELDDDIDEFATANMECTVEIQGFKLSGMAWVDTPGLGSMVEENGELAKEYIQSADYVIYPTNSSSPLQQDEKEQLKELFEQNKKVTICITKSDDMEEDEVDGKLVKVLINKSEENRKMQEDWVKTEVNDIINNKQVSLLGEVISLSVHTAKQGIENKDDNHFENSNMSKFYDLMTDIVQNKAKSLKENTPYDGLKSFVDNNIIGNTKSKGTTTILSLKQNIEEFEDKINERIDKFKTMQSNLDNDITVQIDTVVTKHTIVSGENNKKDIISSFDFFANRSKNDIKQMFDDIDKEISENISNMISENIEEILNDFSVTLNNLTSSLSASDSYNVEEKYVTNTVTYTDNSWSNVYGLFGDRTSTISEEVNVGNNKNEIISNFKANRLDGFIGVAQENYVSIEQDFFAPLKQISKDITANISKLDTDVSTFKNKLK